MPTSYPIPFSSLSLFNVLYNVYLAHHAKAQRYHVDLLFCVTILSQIEYFANAGSHTIIHALCTGQKLYCDTYTVYMYIQSDGYMKGS